MTDQFPAAKDFAHVAELLRKYLILNKSQNVRAVLSNNLNIILAALDVAVTAPDLLAALKALTASVEQFGDLGAALDAARAAIARAEPQP